MNLNEVFDRLKALTGISITEDDIVVPIDSPMLLGATLSCELRALSTANQRQQLRQTTALVQSVSIIAGPRQDETANVGVIYIGGPGVDKQNGYPLSPGSIINLAFADLSKVFFVGGNVLDCLRIVYVAG